MLATVARLFLLLAAVLSCALAEERYTVYLAEEMSEVALKHSLKQIFGEEKEVEFVRLAPSCTTPEEAKRHAHAIEAGVSALPSLVLGDEKGPFATLVLHRLTSADLTRARALAEAPNRHEAHQRRLLGAHVYLLCARTALSSPEDEAGIENAIRACRAVMENDICSAELRQFLGLHCLYPLLMRQYVRGYTGAHTPFTEAKLLEAIAALEAARDIDRDSPDGRKAHRERERLRAARRKSREYE